MIYNYKTDYLINSKRNSLQIAGLVNVFVYNYIIK